MKKNKFLFLVAGVCSLMSCKDDNTVKPVETGSVNIEFQNYVAGKPLELNSFSDYLNANGDGFKVTSFKYYVSNIVLVGENGTTFVEPESYHFINQDESASLSFDLNNVPAGTYNSMQVMFGVDSLRNVSGAQTGALDPSNGMFWTWSSGYIMAKMEGTSDKVGSGGGMLSFHLGGFEGKYNATKTITLAFPQNLEVTKDNSGGVVIKADLATWFASPNLIDFSVTNSIGSVGPESQLMSDNAHNMFSVKEVK